MPRIAKALIAIEIKHKIAPGHHSVGGVAGLNLQVNRPVFELTPKSWTITIPPIMRSLPAGIPPG